jgi:hypothetical protein
VFGVGCVGGGVVCSCVVCGVGCVLFVECIVFVVCLLCVCCVIVV